MARFLHEYWSDRRQMPRLERILAFGRAFLASSALGAIYLDPTEPKQFAAVMYGILSAYAIYSVVVLLLLSRRRPSAYPTAVLHSVDILFASAITFFSEGPISPFFLFFLFVVLAAAYRWGFRETLGTAIVTVAIFLFETVIAMAGPWQQTVFADIPFDLGSTILRATYLLLTGALLGYLADQEKQIRAEMVATTDAMKQPRVAIGLGGSLSSIARLLIRLFDASHVDIVIQDHESARTMLWHLAKDQAAAPASAVRRLELTDAMKEAWLFDTPLRVWGSTGPRSEKSLTATGLDAEGVWAKRSVTIALDPAFTDARQFSSLAAVDFGLAGEWRGRILLFDAVHLEESKGRLQFLASLADHITPVVSNVFLLRRLRSRASAAERARVARELHDGAIQALIGIEMETEAIRRRVEKELPALAPDVAHIQDLMRREVVALRELMQELRPLDLDAPQNLPDLMAGLVERFRRDTGISARFMSDAATAPMPLKTAIEVARMTQEALANVRRHSRADSVLVRLANHGNGWILTVDDNGAGFSFEGRLTDGELRTRWLGPAMLMERARLIGGHVAVESHPGAGARVEVTF